MDLLCYHAAFKIGAAQIVFICAGADDLMLWQQDIDWDCQNGALSLSLFCADEVEFQHLPNYEAEEPREGVFARFVQWAQQADALILMRNSGENITKFDVGNYRGLNLIDVQNQKDELIWDAMLNEGAPVYGLHQELWVQLPRATTSSLVSALRFGLFTSGNCKEKHYSEDRHGCVLELYEEMLISVIVRGGMEVQQIEAKELSWRDHGHEAVIRLRADASGGKKLYTQPRLIAPLS